MNTPVLIAQTLRLALYQALECHVDAVQGYARIRAVADTLPEPKLIDGDKLNTVVVQMIDMLDEIFDTLREPDGIAKEEIDELRAGMKEALNDIKAELVR